MYLTFKLWNLSEDWFYLVRGLLLVNLDTLLSADGLDKVSHLEYARTYLVYRWPGWWPLSNLSTWLNSNRNHKSNLTLDSPVFTHFNSTNSHRETLFLFFCFFSFGVFGLFISMAVCLRITDVSSLAELQVCICPNSSVHIMYANGLFYHFIAICLFATVPLVPFPLSKYTCVYVVAVCGSTLRLSTW